MASNEERFQAAVNVIKGLPKNGPYQPSTAMMLKFYGLFKQATEGSCAHKKPAFWDVVGRTKWDAWNDNRHLSREQAMERYVAGLREIIETMSFTENVQNFVGSIGALDNINLDELEMIAPGMREMAESHPNSPFNSRTNSPQHGTSANASDDKVIEPLVNGHASDSSTASNNALHNGIVSGGDLTPARTPSVDEATGPVHAGLAAPLALAVSKTALHAAPSFISNGTIDQSDDEYGDPVDMNQEITEALVHNTELLKQIQTTVLRMNADLGALNQRMGTLDKSVHELRGALLKTKTGGGRAALRAYPTWWPFADISPAWFVLLVLWPFVVRRIGRVLITPRRQ